MERSSEGRVRSANKVMATVRAVCYSGTISPEPPNSFGKSFSLGRPSRMGKTVST